MKADEWKLILVDDGRFHVNSDQSLARVLFDANDTVGFLLLSQGGQG